MNGKNYYSSSSFALLIPASLILFSFILLFSFPPLALYLFLSLLYPSLILPVFFMFSLCFAYSSPPLFLCYEYEWTSFCVFRISKQTNVTAAGYTDRKINKQSSQTSLTGRSVFRSGLHLSIIKALKVLINEHHDEIIKLLLTSKEMAKNRNQIEYLLFALTRKRFWK